MSLVVDASVALSWVLPDEEGSRSIDLLKLVSGAGATVPQTWHLEVANQLGLKRRASILSEVDLNLAFTLLDDLELTTAGNSWTILAELVSYMNRFRLTAYDAAYLHLAARLRLPIATFDRALIAAAPLAGVALVG